MPTPTITADFTGIWVDFWNTTFKPWLDGALSGSSGDSWPSELTLDGRIVSDYADSLAPALPGSPALAILLPENSRYVIGGVTYTLDDEVTLGPISPNFTGWISLAVDYDTDSEVYNYSPIESLTRPAYGSGVLAKVTTASDRVTTISVTGDDSDVIPTYPVLLQMLRATSGSGGGDGGSTYSGVNPWLPTDTRDTATVVNQLINNAFLSLQNQIEAGGEKTPPVELDELYGLVLGLVRVVRELAPQSMRFLNVATVRPGIIGTTSAPDTTTFDLGGTLPEVTKERNYDAN